jgi:molybdate transport system ATP-binding protein
MLSFQFCLAFKNKSAPSTVIRAAGVINNGFTTGIKGPSGSGKTTLLRVLAGLQQPDEGTLIYNTKVWFDSTKKLFLPVQQRQLSLVFQDYALFPQMTVRKNILYGAKDATFAQHCLEMLKLTKELHKYPHQLSGGQKQRLAIGRALAAKPELLLLDEPFSALDEELKLQLRAEIRELFKSLKQTAVIVSHTTDDLNYLCSTVLTMKTLGENFHLLSMADDSSKKLLFTDKQSALVASASIKGQSTGIRFVS